MIKFGETRLIEGHRKIIHKINLTSIENAINNTEHLILLANNVPPLLPKKIEEIRNNLRQLRPIQSLRVKRWDALGKAWKWIAGSPDAEDLKAITSSLDELVDNSNTQIAINSAFQEKMINISNNAQEIQTLKNLYALDMINNQIEQIQMAIILSKINIVNHNLLTPVEVELIHQNLRQQDIGTDMIEEMLQFITINIAVNEDLVLYIVKIPNLSTTRYETLHLEPLTKNHAMVKLSGKRFLRYQSTILQIMGTCQKLLNLTLCPTDAVNDVSNDECVANIIIGQPSRCEFGKATHNKVMEIGPTTILLNDVNATIQSTCGVEGKILTGSYIITYKNCSVSFDNFTFTNTEIATIEQPVLTPFTDLSVTRTNANSSHNLQGSEDTSSQTHLRKLEHVFTHRAAWPAWTLFAITIVLLVSLKACSRKPNTIKISTGPTMETANVRFFKPPTLTEAYQSR